MIQFTALHPRATADMLGELPFFFDAADPRPAKEQIDERYRHGGGWRPLAGIAWVNDTLVYPGDPPFIAIAEAKLRDERIILFRYSMVAIIQPDGSFEAARVD